MEKEFISDDHIVIQSLQHMLISYEKRLKKYQKTDRQDLVDITLRYIAKLRRLIIQKTEQTFVKKIILKQFNHTNNGKKRINKTNGFHC